MASLDLALKRVNRAAAEAALPLFDLVELDAGRLVTEEGDARDALLFLERGSLAVEAGGIEATRLEAGAWLGEIALFTDGTRTATARALEPVRLRVLRRAAYEALRDGGNAVAWELERIAAHNLARRLGELITSVAQAGPGSRLVTAPTGALAAGRPISATPAQIAKRLAQVPSFADALPGALDLVAAQLSVRQWSAGEKLGAAGQDPPGLVIVLSGEVELVAQVSDGRGIRLETGSAGTLVGSAALVERGAMRGWVAATSPVTGLRAERSRFDRWFEANDPVGSAVRVACVRDLADQVTNANATLSMLALLPRR